MLENISIFFNENYSFMLIFIFFFILFTRIHKYFNVESSDASYKLIVIFYLSGLKCSNRKVKKCPKTNTKTRTHKTSWNLFTCDLPQ